MNSPFNSDRQFRPWLLYKGDTTGWDGSLVTGDDTDIPLPIAIATAGGATINAPAAAITIAGVAPSVAAGKSVSVPAINIAIAGVAPAVSTGKSVSIPAANIDVAAAAPSVSAGKSIAVPAVDVVIAALAPTVSASAGTGATINVPVVDIVVSALAPTVEASAGVVETAQAGGVKKKAPSARFLRRAPRLPWDDPQDEPAEEVVVAKPRKRRIPLPEVQALQAVSADVPVSYVRELTGPVISVPDIPIALPDEDEELLWLI